MSLPKVITANSSVTKTASRLKDEVKWLEGDADGVDPHGFFWRPDLFHEHELASHKQPATRNLVQGQYEHRNDNKIAEYGQSLLNEASTSFVMSVCLSSCLSTYSYMTLEKVCGVLAVRQGLWDVCFGFYMVLFVPTINRGL